MSAASLFMMWHNVGMKRKERGEGERETPLVYVTYQCERPPLGPGDNCQPWLGLADKPGTHRAARMHKLQGIKHTLQEQDRERVALPDCVVGTWLQAAGYTPPRCHLALSSRVINKCDISVAETEPGGDGK